jgi:UDP-N-acetylmuramate dehydrogenase
MTNIDAELEGKFGDRLKREEPLSKHVNYRLGGPAEWFIEVKTLEELKWTVDLMQEYHFPYIILGGGSNTLVADKGYKGVVIKIGLRNFEIEGNRVIADAGVISVALARATANAGLAGMTWAISLPGTIGGAVRGNAGCFGGEIRDTLVSATVLRKGEIIELSNADLKFGYRDSLIKHNDDVVLQATFELTPGDTEQLKAELAETLGSRKETQPLYAGSAGCIFKNYEVKDRAELAQLNEKLDIPESMQKALRISSGWLIEQMQLKGYTVGGAKISDEHGNFIINSDKATASDVKSIIEHVKDETKKRYNIEIEEEVQYVE